MIKMSFYLFVEINKLGYHVQNFLFSCTKKTYTTWLLGNACM